MSDDKRDVTKRNETALTTANYYEKYGRAASNRRFIGDLLKFGKDGTYTAGQENREIERGTQLVAYMPTLRVGWVRWEDGHTVEESTGLIAEGFVPPKRETLGHNDKSLWGEFDEGGERDPWQFSNDLVLFEPQAEQFYTFVTSSKGGLGAIGELAKTYGQRLRQQPGDWPAVALEGDSYQHRIRSRGRIKFPIFRVIGWVAAKDQPALESAEQQQIGQDEDLPNF
jgi:hypothetical protein